MASEAARNNPNAMERPEIADIEPTIPHIRQGSFQEAARIQ
jgi:hypothetical protein